MRPRRARARVRTVVSWGWLSLLAAGCASEPEEEQAYYQAELSSVRYPLPGPIVDHQGRHWSCPSRARYVVDPRPQPPGAPTPSGADVSSSFDDLLQGLRVVTDIHGFECISDPDPALAAELSDPRVRNAVVKKPGSRSVDASAIPLDGSGAQPKHACCDGDERSPFMGELRDALLFSERGCTAFFVHPSVAVTAAHCIYDTSVNAFYQVSFEGQERLMRWRIAVGGPKPYASPTCWRALVPAAFRDAAAAADVPQHDYTFLDFSTNSQRGCPNPTPAPKWLGTWTANDAQLRSEGPFVRMGYPHHVNPSGGPIEGPGLVDQYVDILGIKVDATPWFILRGQPQMQLSLQGSLTRHNLDASEGDSGSPTLKFDGRDWYVVGIHVGDFRRSALQDRRWDPAVLRWIEANSPY